MVRYVVLFNFTEKGIASVKDSPSRAEAFVSAASKSGATVEALYWTLGAYDGALVLNAPDEETAVASILNLGKAGNVRTSMLRAFEAEEFKKILGKVS